MDISSLNHFIRLSLVKSSNCFATCAAGGGGGGGALASIILDSVATCSMYSSLSNEESLVDGSTEDVAYMLCGRMIFGTKTLVLLLLLFLYRCVN